jgi:Fe-S cluster assembly iron-binding protein IscA
MINVTDAARDKIKEVLKENPGKYVRIVIEGFG